MPSLTLPLAIETQTAAALAHKTQVDFTVRIVIYVRISSCALRKGMRFYLPEDVSAAVDAVSEAGPGSAPLRLHAVLRLPAHVGAVGRGALGVVPEATLGRGFELLLGREPRAGGLREGVKVGPVSARLCWPQDVAHICSARAEAASADGEQCCGKHACQAGCHGKAQLSGRTTDKACTVLGGRPPQARCATNDNAGRISISTSTCTLHAWLACWNPNGCLSCHSAL